MRLDKATIGISILGLAITSYVLYRFSGTNQSKSGDDECKSN